MSHEQLWLGTETCILQSGTHHPFFLKLPSSLYQAGIIISLAYDIGCLVQGKDHTLFALVEGFVKFYTGRRNLRAERRFVSVQPKEVNAAPATSGGM